MTLQSSGTITLKQIGAEAGISASAEMRLGSNAIRSLLNKSSGIIKLSDGYGKSNYVSPTYSVSPSVSSVNEGNSVVFNVNTSNVSNGSLLYWNIPLTGGLTSSDFNGATSGTITINNNSASFTVTLSNDLSTEGAENIYATISATSGGTVLATSNNAIINDTSVASGTSSATVTVSNASVGGTINVNYNITDYISGSDVTYSVSPTNAVNNPIGTATNASSGSFALTALIACRYSVSIFVNGALKGSVTGTISASGGQTPTYNATSASSVNEGSSLTVNVTTTNVTNGTTLYWIINYYGAVVGELLSTDPRKPINSFNAYTGNVSISNNAASFTVTPKADSQTEGNEPYGIVFYTDSGRTIECFSGPSFTVNDTSTGGGGTPPVAYTGTITANRTEVYPGQVVVFTITTNAPAGTPLKWTTDPKVGIGGNTFSSGTPLNGSFTSASSNTVTITMKSVINTFDTLLQIEVSTVNDVTIATFGGIPIKTGPTYSISVSPTSVNEGTNFTATLTTTGVANNVLVGWTVLEPSSGITENDFIYNNSPTGDPIINNSVSVSFGIKADSLTEGVETFKTAAYLMSNPSVNVAVSPTITINDTSTAPVVQYGFRAFTSTSAESFTLPSNCGTKLKIYGIGGGGGGGGGNSSGTQQVSGGGGGSSGVAVFREVTGITPGSTIVVTAGVGGVAGEPSNGRVVPQGSSSSNGYWSDVYSGATLLWSAAGGGGGWNSTWVNTQSQTQTTPAPASAGGFVGGSLGTIIGQGTATDSGWEMAVTTVDGNTTYNYYGYGGLGGKGATFNENGLIAWGADGVGGIGDYMKVGIPTRPSSSASGYGAGGGGGGVNAGNNNSPMWASPGQQGYVIVVWGY